MNISSFSPAIFTKDASGIIKQMEAIGFEVSHTKAQNEANPVTSTIMKDKDNHLLTIVPGGGFPQTFTGIRIMVDDFNSAVEEFEKLGFASFGGSKPTDTGSSRASLFTTPDGIMISLAEHLK